MAGLLTGGIEPVSVTAEVPHDARGELESRPELPVLEEDVSVAQARRVEVLALALLGEDSVDALDQATLFEDPDLAVARRNRDPISLADLLRANPALVRREKDLRAVFVGQKLRRLERRH